MREQGVKPSEVYALARAHYRIDNGINACVQTLAELLDAFGALQH
jgi:hypothetical protein